MEHTRFVGLDIHKERISIAVAESGRSGAVEYLGKISNDPDAIGKLCDRLRRPGKTLAFCYEAGPCGYGVYRQLTDIGHRCDVVAPSLIPTKPGDASPSCYDTRAMMRHTLFAIGLTLTFAAPATSGPLEDATAAYEEGDYVTAFRLQLPLAEGGYAQAQVNIGMMYAYGRGVPQNDDEAAAWFRRAAEQNDAFAQHNLGDFYDSGRGVPLDHAEAARWFRKAADQGLADAQYDLGRLYVEGRGVPQDRVLAHMWLSLSAEQGCQKAVGRRNLVTKDMTPAQIAQAEKLARDWKANKHLPE